MGFEFTIKFENPDWVDENRERVAGFINRLPSFVRQENQDEFWLKDDQSGNSWNYDLRLLPQHGAILVEVSALSDAFFRDVGSLVRDLSNQTGILLVDDDDEVFEIERPPPVKP